MQATDDELNALAGCKADLERNLARRNRALDLNMKRLQMRAQRPGREMVSDEVQARLLGQGKMLQVRARVRGFWCEICRFALDSSLGRWFSDKERSARYSMITRNLFPTRV